MPIINHGQSAILTLEAITKQPRVVAGSAIAIRSVVMICLSFDHRVMDGHQAGYFLRDVKERLEAFGPDTGID
jgi:2-oxoisovalerate dehydrogenase E2 component (dihydrolipoyl transacylase)